MESKKNKKDYVIYSLEHECDLNINEYSVCSHKLWKVTSKKIGSML